MKTTFQLIFLLLAISCSANAYTLTFDDVPTGQDLSYYMAQYGFNPYPGWQVVNGLESGWGTAKSGAQEVVSADPEYATGFYFGIDGVSEYTVRSVGAYFTTQPGVVVAMRAYTAGGTIVSATIGSLTGSWVNQYAQISWNRGDIRYIHFESISSPDARFRFAMDDLTIVPVPEPASIFVLSAALMGLGMVARKRRA
jgi:hypothetical protein